MPAYGGHPPLPPRGKQGVDSHGDKRIAAATTALRKIDTAEIAFVA
jgi:hypothetical protein